ncbi:MAG: Fe-S cluster assembly sulfur transfer protein SufU [Chloroflexota bacterium]
MEQMYREIILDHARNGRNFELLNEPDFDHEEHNPLCGDRLRLTLKVEDGVITEVGWDGDGCAISQASASMFGEQLIGMQLQDAMKLDKQVVLDNIGLDLTINRVKCATLSLKTLVVGTLGAREWEKVEDGE